MIRKTVILAKSCNGKKRLEYPRVGLSVPPHERDGFTIGLDL